VTALPELVALLEERIGLDAESIGTSAIARAVRQRLAACRMADDRAYWEHVRSSEAELQELVESIVVPETWFFRDREALTALGRLAVQAQMQRPDTPLRLLSLPCCTGEEPYSMAMTLLDAGLSAERFRVDGVDISERSLALARRAIYGRNSFRGGDLGFRERYFESGPSGYHLAERVRQCVQLRQDNLLQLELPRPPGGYDFIFCRNVLIYFALPAQRRALDTLRDLLAPAGLLFVGPAETGLMMRNEYVTAKIPLAFAFRKGSGAAPASPAPVSAALAPQSTRVPPSRPRRAAVPVAPSAAAIPTSTAPKPPKAPASSASRGAEAEPARWTVADIERLANEGRLDEAATACETLLGERDAGAAVYYLAGMVHGALGHPVRAIDLHRKALYLDPLHADALAHLAYLLDSQGDAAAAEVFRDRARRARERRQA